MPAADFHRYDRKVQVAARDADADATPAQREAGVARVGTVHLHGLRISIEYPKGAVRRGVGGDGKAWSRVVRNHYGYIRGTDSHDGEQLDVWIGDHPSSQLGYLVTFLTHDGEHDEYKCVLGVRNHAEAKKTITDNYPDDFWDTRVGEVRGFVLSDLKKHLADKGLMKAKRKKAAGSGYFCRGCATFIHGRDKDDGCPTCDRDKEAAEDKIPGGEADDLPDSVFDPAALRKGREHEMEHSNDVTVANEIAKDHLKGEGEDYYDRLEQIEKKANSLQALVRLAARRGTPSRLH